MSGCPNPDVLLSPADAMNVPAALGLAEALGKVSDLPPASLAGQPVRQRLWEAAKLVGRVAVSLWSIFDVSLSIEEQLTRLSELAHTIAYLAYGTSSATKFMPTQLYHDVQAVVKNAFFSAAKVGILPHACARMAVTLASMPSQMRKDACRFSVLTRWLQY